ncbi:hypothetical protein J437_LFUL010384 [Ladona fulva]|uniref:DUF4806 domain-containing protein n=1 Tax=Ladona fulva TaxID=123851 RepID=A0A8K0P955_LADFU|nr:hypothetical protein J437_LFUL010384 [Ladona fulva]
MEEERSRFEERMMDKLARIEAQLKVISNKQVSLEEMQKGLWEKMHGLHSTSQPQRQCSLTFNLPVHHLDEFCEVMEKVKDEEVKGQLITLLSQVGGKDLTSFVNGILTRLMGNAVAEKCNWKGQRGEKLDGAPILSIVHGAVIRHIGWETTTEESVKEKIQNWLKQASRRQKCTLFDTCIINAGDLEEQDNQQYWLKQASRRQKCTLFDTCIINAGDLEEQDNQQYWLKQASRRQKCIV